MTTAKMALTRRGLLGAGMTAVAVPALASGWQLTSSNIDVAGSSPALAFTMTRASDGKQVTAVDYRGKIVLLYFGYTFCPDICPLTLTNVATLLKRLGKDAQQMRVLFVTVDPNRDTLQVLKHYVAAFAPEIDGLRGTPDQLVALTRRFRIAYSVTQSGNEYSVTHSSAIYAFDRTGAARLLIPTFASSAPDIDGTEHDLRRLIDGGPSRGPFSHLLGVLEGLV